MCSQVLRDEDGEGGLETVVDGEDFVHVAVEEVEFAQDVLQEPLDAGLRRLGVRE